MDGSDNYNEHNFGKADVVCIKEAERKAGIGSMIDLKNIYFSYGLNADINVFENFSLEIKEDEFIAVMGESGIGKSTLIRLILGLETPKQGSITGLDGKRISVVWQENRLLTWYNVLKNVMIASSSSGKVVAMDILRSLRLDDCIYKYPNELSGGQQRRVAIARALYYGGDLVLLDEPFTGLDAELKAETAFLIKKYFRSALLITHDKTEAELLGCERIIVISDKEIGAVPRS